MAFTSQRVTVSTSAIALNTATSGGQTLTLTNQDATNTVSLGPSGVTAGAGYRLGTNATVQIKLQPGEVVFAIRDGAADVIVSVLRQGA